MKGIAIDFFLMLFSFTYFVTNRSAISGPGPPNQT